MPIRARVLGFSGALFAAIFLVTSTAVAQQQQQKKDEKKLDKAQQQEINAAVQTVDDVMTGQAGPAEVPVTLQYHFMKARDQRTYMPMVVTFDNKLSGQLVYYLRVVNPNAPPPPAPKKEAPKRDPETGEIIEQPAPKPQRPEYAFEDVRFMEVKPTANGEPHHLSVAASLPAGEHDVYVLVRQRGPKEQKKNTPPPPGGLVKQRVTVPNFWADELMLSSVILSNKTEQAAPTDAAAPYVFGTTKITPSRDNKFAKTDELSIIFQIYNTATAAGGKPDVTVDYNFYQKTGGAEKFFNKTNPQAFNAETLPPQFDLAAGHTLVGGLSIPLASFPEGEYRLEIKVTDKASSKTKVENVSLTVAGA